MLTEEQAQNMSPLDLVNVIDISEGEIWRMTHDVGHGRTTKEQIASPVSECQEQKELAYKVLGEKTGITSREEILVYGRDKLKEQKLQWDNEWNLLHSEGVVFRMIPGAYAYCPGNFEVVGAYVARHGNCSYKELVVARLREKNGIKFFDERDIPQLERISCEPIFQGVSPEERGLIKVDECLERRPRDEITRIPCVASKQWGDFNFAGTFVHFGFGKFHTIRSYNTIKDGRDSDNEIIIAYPLSGQKYWVEFKEADMVDMELIKK